MNNLQLEHFNVTGHSDFPFKFTLKGYAEGCGRPDHY